MLDSIPSFQSHSAWAVCRLPYTDHPTLYLQTKGKVEALSSYTELNGKEGFVMAPFEIHTHQPILLIHPDHTLHGWQEIETYGLFKKQSSFLRKTTEDTTHLNNDSKPTYKRAFQDFIQVLREAHFHKLVLSRRSVMSIPPDFSPWDAFKEACRRYPRMMIYLCYTPQAGMWMGSSPEIILSGIHTQWHTVSLAGTMLVQNDKLPHSWDHKNHIEQQFVSDYLRPILQSIGQLTEEKGPYPVQAGELAHLKTDFQFTLPSSDRLGNILQSLHPTPAVCGLPKEKAYRFILEREGYPRRYYAGFTGWISPTSSTELYVNLRCMELKDRQAVLYAGGGILPESEFDTEWNETEEKMKTMKSILYSSFTN